MAIIMKLISSKYKKYKEIVIFIKQNGINNIIKCKNKSYEYGRFGIYIKDDKTTINIYAEDFKVRGFDSKDGKIYVTLLMLARILRELKQNIDTFLKNYTNEYK